MEPSLSVVHSYDSVHVVKTGLSNAYDHHMITLLYSAASTSGSLARRETPNYRSV